jgi:hypothetical protein
MMMRRTTTTTMKKKWRCGAMKKMRAMEMGELA